MSAADKMSSADATNVAHTTAAPVNVHQPDHEQHVVDNEFKGLDTEHHAPARAELPKFDSDGIQIASMNVPYIFIRAVFVPSKLDVSNNKNGEAEKTTHPARGAQGAEQHAETEKNLRGHG